MSAPYAVAHALLGRPITLASLSAVSYTHLDVYKRQVLHSMDAGKSWMVQLDGVSAKTEFEAYYNSLIASGNGALSVPLQQVHVNYDNGPTLPWLGIWLSLIHI